ncbi:MAG: alpha/beta hydrolase family protein [Akkermansiaceae bacterium]
METANIKNSHDERIDCAFHQGEKSDRLVIIAHGVTGNKDRPMLITLAEELSAKGWPCLRISFSGNGGSEGEFTDSNITKEVADLLSVIDQAGGGKKIAYIGHSMGGAVGALAAARDERINVLVSLAGMVRTAEFAKREFGDVTPGQGVMWEEEEFPLSQAYMDDLTQIDNTLEAAASFRLPWLLVHGTEDDVVFPSDSHTLIDAIKGDKRLLEIEGAGHSFENHYSTLAEEINAWLKKHL